MDQKEGGGGPTRGFSLYVAQNFLEEDVMMFWGGGWEYHENNGRCGDSKMDWYNINYRGRRLHRYL